MSPSSAFDRIDSRPSFDVAVGLRSVLLILVGALVFQQAQDGVQGTWAQSQLRHCRPHRHQSLERLVAVLQSEGPPARADTAGGAVMSSGSGALGDGQSGGPRDLAPVFGFDAQAQ